jgi:hypothetical protein
MNPAIQRVKEELQAFVDQRDDFVQVIHALDTEFAIIMSALKAVEDETPSDIFLHFSVPCTSLDGYLETIFIRAKLCIEKANEELAVDGSPLLEPLPTICDDASATVTERLRGMVDHFRGLAGDPLDSHLILAFLPLQITDQEAYASIITGFFPREGHDYWMRGVRVLVRDDAAAPFVVPYLQQNIIGDIRVLNADLSPAALIRGLQESAGDTEIPMLERVLGLMQLAGLDLAYKKYPEAVLKFKAAYKYFTQEDNTAQRGVCLHGMGLAAERGGSPARGKVLFQQGLGICAPVAQALPVTLILTSSLGDVCHRLKEYEEAHGYYGLAAELATGLGNLPIRVEAMLKQGDVRRDQRQTVPAITHWVEAAEVCKEFLLFDLWRESLARQHALCSREGLEERVRAVEFDQTLVNELEKRQLA